MTRWSVWLQGPYRDLAYGLRRLEKVWEVEAATAADAIVIAKCRSQVYEDPEWKCVSCEPMGPVK